MPIYFENPSPHKEGRKRQNSEIWRRARKLRRKRAKAARRRNRKKRT